MLLSASADVMAQSTYTWSANTGTWDTTTANWTGAGSTWVDSNQAVFNAGTSPSTVTLSGTINAASLLFGTANASSNGASFTLTGGTLNTSGNVVIQGSSGNFGAYASNPTTTINTNATITGSTLIGRANLTISGGTYITDRISANPASPDWANLTISGGTVVATNGIDGRYGISGTNGTTAAFQLNLNGGTLYTPSIAVANREVGTNNNAVLTFNGTEVRATADTQNFITLFGGGSRAFISNGGAIINTFDDRANAARNITIGVQLVNTSGQTGSLTKRGEGTLTLTGNNAFTGSTTINGGTLVLSADANSNTSDITINSSSNLTFASTNQRSFTRAISGTAGNITFNVAGNTTDSGGGDGTNFTFANTGNTFTGTIVINTGLVAPNNDSAFGNSANTIRLNAANGSSAGLVATQNLILNRSIVLANAGGNGIFRAYTGNTLTLDGVVSGAGNFVKTDGGTVRLTNANTFTGTTRVGGGTMILANAQGLQNSTLLSAVTFDSSVSSNAFTLGGLSGSVNMALQNNATTPAAIALSVGNNNSDTTHSGNLSGAGSLTKIGTGILTLSGTNSFSGGLQINQGVVAFTSDNNLGNSGGSMTLNGGTLKANSSVTIGATRTITLGSNGGTFSNGSFQSLTMASRLTGTGTLSINYDSSANQFVSLTHGSNDYSGDTRIGTNNAGFFQNNGAAAHLRMGTTNALAFGAGRGNVIVGFQANGAAQAILDLNGFATSINGLSTNNAANASVNNSSATAATLTLGHGNASASFGGVIRNTGGALSLVKTGTGTQTLSGVNTYTGATQINEGTLALSGSGSISSSSSLTLAANTTLDITGVTNSFQLGSSQSLSGNGRILATGKTVVAAGTLTPGASPGTLVQDGGVLQLAASGQFNWEIANAAGTAGSGYDTVSLINGATLDLSLLSANNPYQINLWSLSGTGPFSNGLASNFDNTQSYEWTLFSTTQAINNFSSDLFAVNIGATNGTGGFANDLNGGTFSVILGDNNTDLMLRFNAIPETSVSLLGVLGALTFLRRRR